MTDQLDTGDGAAEPDVRPTRRRRAPAEDAGYVVIMFAIMLPVLFGLAALAVDVSNWYLAINRQQKAADAGALAGVIYLPGDFNTAKTTALAVATRNGYTDGAGGATINVALGAKSTQLQVTITGTVHNFFGRIPLLGAPFSTFTRTGVADYAGPLHLGSPCNVLGNDAMSSPSVASAACSANSSYWLNMAGAFVNKSRGDANGSHWCSVADDGSGIDGCTGLPGPYPGVQNSEVDPRGYLYNVNVGTGAPPKVQIYDGIYVATGNTCTGNDSAGNAVMTGVPAPLNTAPYCSGDNSDGGQQSDDSAVTTTINLYFPSSSSTDPLASGLVCAPLVLPGFGPHELAATPLADLLSGKDANPDVQNYFHQWATICPGATLTPTTYGSDYTVQVQTSGPDGAIGGGGQNRFALRADAGSAGANDGLSVSALQHMSLYFNEQGKTAAFNLVRLPTSAADHQLTIRFFDLGDATNGDTVKISPPDNSSLGSGAWDASGACTADNDHDPIATGSQAYTGPLTNCSVTTTAAQDGGRWQIVKIPLPANYTCNTTDPTKCWVSVTLNSSADLSDTTTWEASLDGDPVRLVV